MKQRSLLKKILPALLLGGIIAGLGAGLPGAATGDASERPRFGTNPALAPAFAWNRSDYVIRCAGSQTSVELESPAGWRGAVGGRSLRTGSYSVNLGIRPNRPFTVRFRHDSGTVKRFHVRCLPADFPAYRFSGRWKGGPRLLVAQLPNQYAAAFDRNGAPLWWFRTPEGSPNDAKFLADGTFSYAPVDGVSFRRFVIRNLAGGSLRTMQAAGNTSTDLHDLILLPNGNYLLGAHRMVGGVNTARFGGSANATIDTAQLQEQTPSGRLVWKWDAYPRIALRETGRWWKTVAGWGTPYDIHHWNSIERKGRFIMLSFRHLDAVYMINRRNGRIVWKLGGVKTKKSLRVRRDPNGRYPFGGQHDARFRPGNSVTVFDNATNLKRKQPRAVRYRIQPRKRLATLVDQVKDRRARQSIGMASARLTGAGWFIGWGAIGPQGMVGGYLPGGKPLFRLDTPGGFAYRLHPVETRRPSLKQLRRAMNRMASRNG